MKSTIIGIVLFLLVAAGAYYFFTQYTGTAEDISESTETGERIVESDNNIMPEGNTSMVATIQTNHGEITLEFFSSDAPATVENFTKLTKEGFYNGTKFHRVIKGFMIQGGDPLTKDDSQRQLWGTGGPGYKFEDEIHTNNQNNTGTIAMANSGPNTNGSQFFINATNNNFLDELHTVFGRVVAGMDVVRAIENVPVGGSEGSEPVESVIIESITITEN